MIRTRLSGDPDYIVTAQIINATAEDGSALDSGPELDYCGPNELCKWTAPKGAGDQQQGTSSPSSNTNGTGKTGGAGSGGMLPGGLPLNLPQIPSAAKWLIYAALFGAGLLVIDKAKR